MIAAPFDYEVIFSNENGLETVGRCIEAGCSDVGTLCIVALPVPAAFHATLRSAASASALMT